KEYPIIKLKDLNRYKGIYSKMTTAQKENSQVWPKLPPIPAPSPAPAKTLKSNQNKKTIKPIEIEIDKNNNIVLNGKSVAFDDLANRVSELNKELTIEEKRNYVTPSIIIDSEKNLHFFKKVSKELMKVDIWSNSLVYAENQKKLGLPAKHYHPTAGLTIEEAKAQQEQALKDYKENTKPDKNSPWAIEMGVNEVEVYETPEIKTGFIKINNLPHYFITIDGNTKYYDSSGFQISKEGDRISQTQVNASDLIPGHYITKVYSDNKVVASFKDNMPSNNNSTMDIPSPPMPESTLDFIIKMAKANAKFFNEGKSISSDDAITLLKKNPKLNVTSHKTETDQPLVYMSKKPILIGAKAESKN
ncbi:MAG: hypothetical protein NWP87_03100, partial [Winogradskyella sp.]|nr:hypothetical protein [Winogradskyella sp.]